MTGVLLALGGAPWEPGLVAALPVGTGLRLARRCVDLDDLVVAGCAGAATAAVVAAGLPRLDRDALARLAAAGVVVVGVAADDAGRRRLRELGASRVVLVDPDDPAGTASLVARAVGEAMAGAAPPSSRGYAHAESAAASPEAAALRSDGAGDDADDADGGSTSRRGALVAVWGPAGSPGRTTVAVALADEAARAGVRVLLVDADTRAASVAPLLGLPDDVPGLAAACRAADRGRLTAADLDALCRPAAAGLRVLTGLPRPDRWVELRPAAMEVVLDVARRVADLVVVDVGASLEVDDEAAIDVLAPRRDAAALTTLDAADACVAVAAAEPLGLLRLVPALDVVREHWPRLPLRVVAMRLRRSALGPAPEAGVRDLLARHAGVADAYLVPDDRAAFDTAVLAARTIAESAPGSPARLALRRLADDVRDEWCVGAAAPHAPSTTRPWRQARRLARARGA